MAASHVSYDQSAGAQKNDFDFRVDTDASVATAILQDWVTLQYIITDAINIIETRFAIHRWLYSRCDTIQCDYVVFLCSRCHPTPYIQSTHRLLF